MFLVLLVRGGQDLAFEGDNLLQRGKQHRVSDWSHLLDDELLSRSRENISGFRW
jgi:hypothetical protein